MKKALKIIGIIVGVILLFGTAGYFVWFQNTAEHTLKLQASAVYSPDKSNNYLITNANIIDVETGVVVEGQNLIIQDGIFEYIFAGRAPDSLKADYEVIDAKNRYLLPGMIDMHTHLNSGGLMSTNVATRPMALEQFARYGVGTIFTLGGHGFNQEITAALRDKQRKHEVVGPIILAAGDVLTEPGGYPISYVPMISGLPEDEIDLDEQGVLTITDETDLDAIFSTKKKLGLDGIKVMVESNLDGNSAIPRLSNQLLRKIVQKASRYSLPVFAHVTRQADLQDAVDAGVDVIVHTTADQLLTDAGPLLEKMVRNSVAYTPTLSGAHGFQYVSSGELLEDPFMLQYSSERTNRSLKNWPLKQLMLSLNSDKESFKDTIMQNFTIMHEAGVTVLMGSDAGPPMVIPGYSAHKELEYMVEGGMTNAEALRAATIAPAEFLKMDDRMGSIEEGKIASFLMLEKNPLDDVKNSQTINRVMLEGYWIE
ncbi:amidohydrolase family protein [Neolewinella antarctica]|uniref:Imidazolonepropionase-like amidohydrolase n=1 Tax=Neolewinella antarctica TaxID=442734 RepID=A0ABX0X9Y6_9BACT|nr:amidohydrolase family protein [Neolewinella antarctica]NJC25638.1 imidazolonepropionase-like amidohydrolase [Neolewinella antarctica]